MKKNTKRISLISAVISIIAIAVILPAKTGGRPVMKMEHQETVHSVKAQTVQKQNLTEYLTMNGNVQATSTISVYSEIGGKITRVYVTLGTSVKRGEIIAEVDPSVPGSRYESSPVTAPISGTITALPLDVGTTVSTNTAVAQIGNINELQIKARVPERDIAVLKNGLKAEVNLVAYKDKIFTARVIRVSPIVDEVSRSKEIYFSFDEKNDFINAGMYAKIKLYTTEHKKVIAVPFDAVRTIDSKYFVYVINDDSTVSQTEVTLGVNVDGTVQISEGLSEGQKIVVSGSQSLTDGAKVKEI